MSLDFFLGPDLFSLLRRYVLLTALRCGWFFINGGFYARQIYLQESVTPLPWGFLHGVSSAFSIVDGMLALGQLALLVGFSRILIVHYLPAQAAAWKLIRAPSAARKPRRSILMTALLLCSLVVLTCGLVPWALQAWGGRYPQPFVEYLSHRGAPSLMVAGVLCLLGIAWGGGHSARAASDMTTSFRVVLVGEDHWLYKRVKRIADELGLPTPKVGITNVTNAFAMGSSPADAQVIIGQPLLSMEPDELDAIIGHELGHVMSNDVQRMQFAEGFQIMLAKVISFATVILAIFAAAAASQSKNRGVNPRMGFQATMGVGNLVRGTVFIASELVVKGISRSREFHADAVGAQVTSTEAMVRALQRIHGVAVKPTNEERQYGYLMFRGAGLGNLFGTHPTLGARVKALETRAKFRAATDRALETASAKPQSDQVSPSVEETLAAGLVAELTPSEPQSVPLSGSDVRFTDIAGSLKALEERWQKRKSALIRVCVAGVIIALAVTHPVTRDYTRDYVASAAALAKPAWEGTAATFFNLGQTASGLALFEATRKFGAELQAKKKEANDLAAMVGAKSQEVFNTKLALSKAQSQLEHSQDLSRSYLSDIAEANRKIASLQSPTERSVASADPSAELSAQLDAQTLIISDYSKQVVELQTSENELRTRISSLETQLADGDAGAVWGGVATDSRGKVYTIPNQVTEESAQNNILSICRGASKDPKSCRLIGTHSNNCFSLARINNTGVTPTNYRYFVGNDAATSEGTAVRMCMNLGQGVCVVAFTSCSPHRLARRW